MKITDYFKIRPTNEENNDFIITIGKHLATECHFKSVEDAKRYIRTPKWETIFAIMGEVLDIQKEQIINELKNEKA